MVRKLQCVGYGRWCATKEQNRAMSREVLGHSMFAMWIFIIALAGLLIRFHLAASFLVSKSWSHAGLDQIWRFPFHWSAKQISSQDLNRISNITCSRSIRFSTSYLAQTSCSCRRDNSFHDTRLRASSQYRYISVRRLKLCFTLIASSIGHVV